MRNFVERNFVGGVGGHNFFLQQSNNNTHNNNNNNNNSNKKKKKKKKRLLSIPNEIFWCHSKAQVNPRLQCAYRSIPTCPQSCRREKDTKQKDVHRGSRSSPRLQVILQIVRGLFCCKSYVRIFVCWCSSNKLV